MAKKKADKKDWRADPNGMPRTLYVTQETFAEGREEFLANMRPAPLIGDDGPTLVGKYELVSVERLMKRVVTYQE